MLALMVLTTDATGSYTGWFISEPTGNARFTPGNNLFMRIRMNDGATGTTAVHWATTSDSVKVLNYGLHLMLRLVQEFTGVHLRILKILFSYLIILMELEDL